MRIAMISPEIAPFAKTGGLADVVETLALALARRGHQLCLLMPAYRSVLSSDFPLQDSGIGVSVEVSNRRVQAQIFRGALSDNAVVYFIRADAYFDRPDLYRSPAGDYPDNAERFVFFSRAALEVLRHVPVTIVHAHDWQSAMAIVFLRAERQRYPELAATKTLFTIHNLGFQGVFWRHDWHLLNLDPGLFNPSYLEFYGSINFLKGALIFADKLTTVSPTYAQEIMTPEQGFGLDGVLRDRARDLVGILNGVDYSRWNPATDPFIAKRYTETNASGKRACKKALQLELGFPPDAKIPLLAMISRLTPQKGLDLIESIFVELIARNVQMVFLGTGDPRYEAFLQQAAAKQPGSVAARIVFDEVLAHRIEAGADIFLMPSLYEPCGLNQMFSLKYGTIPVVRSVGGLRDTVADYEPGAGTGTGFIFYPYDARELLTAIDRALAVFKNRDEWARLRRRAMAMDFSWDRSAEAYERLYYGMVG